MKRCDVTGPGPGPGWWRSESPECGAAVHRTGVCLGQERANTSGPADQPNSTEPNHQIRVESTTKFLPMIPHRMVRYFESYMLGDQIVGGK